MSQFVYWSGIHDRKMMRLSLYDSHRQEYWCLLDAQVPGAKLRAEKQRALDALAEAVETGFPGEVRI